MRRGAPALLLLGTTLVAAACGYRLAARDAPAREADVGAMTLAIPVLANESSEPGIELMVTDAILREFLQGGRFRVVEDPTRADWVLRGSVLPVRIVGQSFSSVILALEYTVELRLAVALEPRDGEPVPFDPDVLRDAEIYLASADLEAMRKNRREALRRVAGVLAERIHDTLVARRVP